MNGLIKKRPIEKSKLLNEAIIKKYFSNWTNIGSPEISGAWLMLMELLICQELEMTRFNITGRYYKKDTFIKKAP